MYLFLVIIKECIQRGSRQKHAMKSRIVLIINFNPTLKITIYMGMGHHYDYSTTICTAIKPFNKCMRVQLSATYQHFRVYILRPVFNYFSSKTFLMMSGNRKRTQNLNCHQISSNCITIIERVLNYNMFELILNLFIVNTCERYENKQYLVRIYWIRKNR